MAEAVGVDREAGGGAEDEIPRTRREPPQVVGQRVEQEAGEWIVRWLLSVFGGPSTGSGTCRLTSWRSIRMVRRRKSIRSTVKPLASP